MDTSTDDATRNGFVYVLVKTAQLYNLFLDRELAAAGGEEALSAVQDACRRPDSQMDRMSEAADAMNGLEAIALEAETAWRSEPTFREFVAKLLDPGEDEDRDKSPPQKRSRGASYELMGDGLPRSPDTVKDVSVSSYITDLLGGADSTDPLTVASAANEDDESRIARQLSVFKTLFSNAYAHCDLMSQANVAYADELKRRLERAIRLCGHFAELMSYRERKHMYLLMRWLLTARVTVTPAKLIAPSSLGIGESNEPSAAPPEPGLQEGENAGAPLTTGDIINATAAADRPATPANDSNAIAEQPAEDGGVNNNDHDSDKNTGGEGDHQSESSPKAEERRSAYTRRSGGIYSTKRKRESV